MKLVEAIEVDIWIIDPWHCGSMVKIEDKREGQVMAPRHACTQAWIVTDSYVIAPFSNVPCYCTKHGQGFNMIFAHTYSTPFSRNIGTEEY